jgi:hypothetical protein
MTYGIPFWQELGIEATEDQRDIKRAYASKLKAMDVDADPEAFIALRHARDWALQAAEHGYALESVRQEDEADNDNNDGLIWNDLDQDDDEDWQPSPNWWRVEREEDSQTLTVEQDHAVDDKLNEIRALLFADQDAPVDPARLHDLTSEIVASPELERVDRHNQVELLLAQTVQWGGNRADPVLFVAADHFDWHSEVSALNQNYFIDHARARLSDIRYRDEQLEYNRHLHHHGWTQLKKAAKRPEWAVWATDVFGNDVNGLIQELKARHPSILGEFEPKLIETIEEAPKRRGIAIFCLLLLISAPLLLLGAMQNFLGVAVPGLESSLFLYVYGGTALVIAALMAGFAFVKAKLQPSWDYQFSEDTGDMVSNPREWLGYAGLAAMPVFASALPASFAATVTCALLCGIAVIMTGTRFHPSPEPSFLVRWYLRIMPVLLWFVYLFGCFIGSGTSDDVRIYGWTYQMFLPVLALTWALVAGKPRIHRLAFDCPAKTRRIMSVGVIVLAAGAAVIGAHLLNTPSSQMTLSDQWLIGMCAALTITAGALADMIWHDPRSEISLQLYYGYFYVVPFLAFVAVPIVLLMSIRRMVDTIGTLNQFLRSEVA